ncbi:hypothetical protein LSH36_1173g00061 [Paralvinella palmiformis]|uniref:Uncharacterized protein n=1 Tax=Paralvinella palmiformis TaxID=53620 RepID=A0AAD9IVJ8_9ANNE|nr:hypothetical protein LSH36_1173g00061 [Paralvinella palmiformis]
MHSPHHVYTVRGHIHLVHVKGLQLIVWGKDNLLEGQRVLFWMSEVRTSSQRLSPLCYV